MPCSHHRIYTAHLLKVAADALQRYNGLFVEVLHQGVFLYDRGDIFYSFYIFYTVDVHFGGIKGFSLLQGDGHIGVERIE